MILTLDRNERKMSLGMKQLTKNPWEGIDSKYLIESKHVGKVTNYTTVFFLEMEEGN